MKSIIFALILLTAGFTAPSAFSEAIVLPPQTVITWPNGSILTIADSSFLIPRADMEQATYALEVLPVNEKTIRDLQALADKQAAQIKSATTWMIIIGVGAGVAGMLLGALVH